MESNKERHGESSFLKEPYIGMPIYIEDDEGDYMDNNMANVDVHNAREKIVIEEEEMGNNMENYCRDSNFENWPVAMAYVPWQKFTEVYEPGIGFEVGTIFPDLNLPFLGGARK